MLVQQIGKMDTKMDEGIGLGRANAKDLTILKKDVDQLSKEYLQVADSLNQLNNAFTDLKANHTEKDHETRRDLDKMDSRIDIHDAYYKNDFADLKRDVDYAKGQLAVMNNDVLNLFPLPKEVEDIKREIIPKHEIERVMDKVEQLERAHLKELGSRETSGKYWSWWGTNWNKILMVIIMGSTFFGGMYYTLAQVKAMAAGG